MKRFMFLASVMLATLMLTGCNPGNQPEKKSPKGIKVIDKSYAESYYGYANGYIQEIQVFVRRQEDRAQ